MSDNGNKSHRQNIQVSHWSDERGEHWQVFVAGCPVSKEVDEDRARALGEYLFTQAGGQDHANLFIFDGDTGTLKPYTPAKKPEAV